MDQRRPAPVQSVFDADVVATESESAPPPTYDEATANLASNGTGAVRDDGRIDIDLNSRLSRTLSRLVSLPPPHAQDVTTTKALPSADTHSFPLRLNIVIQVVGSRGDVQPFVALGNALQKHGHRVRLATHAKFKVFVLDSNLEFYPIGGDPEELMSYMVKNPGLIPNMKSLQAGDIKRKRSMIATMLEGCWRSCIEPDPSTDTPFVADAIIANPPSFAHIHCAEALGIPVHIMFTMPWTGTRSFPHPLANTSNNQKDPKLANYLSYVIVEWMTWQGLGDVINGWRKAMDLVPISRTEGPMLAESLRIPHTYCWSPALIAKPPDWPAHVDVSGFFFRDAPEYEPTKTLRAFLDAGPPPVYVGFGSIVLDDAKEMSSVIIDAVTACGVRAIVSRGWSCLDGPERPDIFWLGDCPHEWLFRHVASVVHHGGAGTTACGLLNAKPTTIVPFFGDQPFWGSMVSAAGAGPEPIPYKMLNANVLAAAIRFCQTEAARTAAGHIATQMKQENGVQAAVRSFHSNLPLGRLQCDILPGEPAVYTMKLGGKRAHLSKLAAGILIKDAGLDSRNFKFYRPSPIVIENRRWDPVTGTASSMLATGTDMVNAASGIFLKPVDAYARNRDHDPSPNSNRPLSQRSASARPGSSTSARGQHEPCASTRPSFESLDTACSGITIVGEGTTGDGTPRGRRIARDMAVASGKSLGKVLSTYTKGGLVDIPLATTEGFRALPRLWGDEVKDYGKVKGWQSGFSTAGRSFVQGIGDGLRDIVVQPVKGGRQEGAWGAAKGLAKGSASLVTKTVSGSLGLVAYPGQGISKSLFALAHSSTSKGIMEGRRLEGIWRAEMAPMQQRLAALDRYHEMQYISS